MFRRILILLLVSVASLADIELAWGFGEEHREAIRLHCEATTTGSAARTACVVEALRDVNPARLVDLSEHPASAARRARLACGPRQPEGIEVYDACLRRTLGISASQERPPVPPSASPPLADTERPSAPGPVAAGPAGVTVVNAPPESQVDARVLFADLGKSVFVVFAAEHERSDRVTQGSAVAIAPNLLLTNCHVVEARISQIDAGSTTL